MTKNYRLILLTISIYSALVSCSPSEKKVEHSTESSLADLKVYEGLEVTLFASEPMLTNPTNIDVDSRGRVWVCEAYNYRSKMNPKNPVKNEGDRILILEDTDGDGKADKQTVFYQGPEINSALGVCVLGTKVIVSCSPNVFVFTDSNGDDVPEKKEVLFSGIQGEQHDHGVHSFTFGHDGRLYFTMGNEGKNLLSSTSDTIVDKRGYKVITNGKPFREGLLMRCNPDGSDLEVVGHNFRNNYEATVDPFGSIWQSDNDDDGNKGTRINFVMEHGNYGYKDEMTGASWPARRTNIEKEIPLRHWHLNDPGVVPNLLQNGSGSPAGMTMYEGELLPEVFRGQMIHAEAGQNVVRSYSVEKEGAGYKATIVNVLEGQEDQWFRPIDVSIAPDGSLFVADWYDPGVGGHQVGDLERGRIYRVAPKNSAYKIQSIKIEKPEDAVNALLNPNVASRYLASTYLATSGNTSEEALQKIWRSDNSRHRAQVLWLLAKLKDKGDTYINEAIHDANSDIRITGLRVARALNKDIIPLAAGLINDPSLQVKREIALSLCGKSSTEAANLWSTLAMQYDGKDRWYIEALGIGAHGNWDLYFNAWKNKIGTNWNTPSNRDIIWRSRSKYALTLMADIIRAADEKEMLRYYRSFDFHTDPSKHAILAQLAIDTKGEKAMYALKHLDATKIKVNAALIAKLNDLLNNYENKPEYVEMVNAFHLTAKAPELIALSLKYPDSLSGKEAMKTIVRWDRSDLIAKILHSNATSDIQAVIKTLQSQMSDSHVIAIMENFMNDSLQDLSLRKAAVRTFGGPEPSEKRLLQLAKENKIPEELSIDAVSVFQNTWRRDIRDEAAKYLKLPAAKEGNSLPDVADLAFQKGDALKGKEIFKLLCSTCHQVKGEGTDFGPNLSEIGDKLSKEAMYKAILFPDQGISFGFEGYSFTLKDGTKAFGKIVSETEREVQIQYISNTQTLNKNDIVSRIKSNTSLMPANLQAGMSEQEFVNLVEFLIQLKRE